MAPRRFADGFDRSRRGDHAAIWEREMIAAELMASARAATGLDDFGDDSFRSGLERLAASINTESALSDFGRAAMPGMIVKHLSNRLQIEDWYRRHPEIAEERIVDPVFIVGLPRTGTTTLGHLLALDKGTRVLRAWEAAEPCPPPELATADSDPRIDRSDAGARAMEERSPGLGEALPRDGSKAPTECLFLFDVSLASIGVDGFVHVPSYMDWLMTDGLPEMDAAYRYHERILKLLQWRHPARRWSLRGPTHSMTIEALNRVYPQARFIWTHRNPSRVVPSVALLMHTLRCAFLADPVPQKMGPLLIQKWSTAMQRLLDFRDRVGEGRFIDVSHGRQIDDPISVVRTLYDRLGWPYDEAMTARIAGWREANPKGSHNPDPSIFAIDDDALQARFAPYIARFSSQF
jgi:hypothetical protein